MAKEKMSKQNESRRSFLTKTGTAVAAGAVASQASPAFGVHTSGSNTLRVGLIGCGGRGTGAAINAANADPGVEITALADAFGDRILDCEETLRRNKKMGKKVKVTPETRFSGFDAADNLINSGVDMVILATPPHFRPEHMRLCVEAGKHVFCEKPVGVDVPGVRSVMETCEMAKQKGLSVVSGLCWRYDLGVREVVKRIQDGAIGDIHTMQENYLTGTLWHRGENPDWSQMEYQLRNWLYFNWLSGDHLAEQHIHSIDKSLWLMGDEPPVSCYSTGGRLVRTQKKWGNVYDHFATVYEWANGVKVFSHCRQMAGCFNDVNDYIFGSKGNAQILSFKVNGEKVWKGRKISMYDSEHIELMKSIRSGQPINNGKYMCISTLMALMGRDAAYTGKKIKWEDYMKSDVKLGPKSYEWGDYEPAPVAKPGSTW